MCHPIMALKMHALFFSIRLYKNIIIEKFELDFYE
jgi:hypothetical protein